jgi:hypothetical protein
MNHFFTLVLAVICVIALSIFYSLAAIFFLGIIATGRITYLQGDRVNIGI